MVTACGDRLSGESSGKMVTACGILLHRQKDVFLGGRGNRAESRRAVLPNILTWSSYMLTENKGATVHSLSPLTIPACESLFNSDAVSDVLPYSLFCGFL